MGSILEATQILSKLLVPPQSHKAAFSLLSAFVLSLMVLSGVPTFGNPGDLDLSFGSNGKVSTPFVTVGDHTRRLSIQSDGKILVLASDELSLVNYPDAGTIRRFLSNGALDPTFAGSGSISFDGLRDFDILSDGRIVTVQTVYALPTYSRVCRFTVNGIIDPSFGTSGCRNVQAEVHFQGRRIKAQGDDRIVIAGPAGGGQTHLARLLPNGSMDNSFGSGGVALAPGGDMYYFIVGPWVLDKTGPLEIQPDGKILFGFSFDWDSSVYIGRLNQDGSVDSGFGVSGGVSIGIPIPGYPYDGFAFGTLVQPDGKILITGTALEWFGANSYVTVARLRNDGTYDPSFGSGGAVSFVSSESRGPASAVILLPNDQILIGGMDDEAFSLMRLNENGSIDTRFGNNGIIQTPFGMSSSTSILLMELQNDGSLITAGSINGAGFFANIGLAKYLNVASTPGNTQYDFDGDGKADISVFRPSDTVWYLDRSTAGFSATQFGIANDVTTAADFDGDGKTDIGVFRDGTWYWLNSSNGDFNARQFGQPSDVPVPADYTGDGRADLAIFRSGEWWIQDIANNTVSVTSFGLATDKPLVADYDGDGRSDIAVFRNGEWHLRLSDSVYTVVQFGLAADIPLIGDFDGDGKSDPAVYRQGVWYVLGSTAGYSEFAFGLSTDLPVPADYDGDGKTDAAIYREGAWWVRQSSTQSAVVSQFGINGDRPLPYRAETQ